jgi:hypothetical protein
MGLVGSDEGHMLSSDRQALINQNGLANNQVDFDRLGQGQVVQAILAPCLREMRKKAKDSPWTFYHVVRWTDEAGNPQREQASKAVKDLRPYDPLSQPLF